MTDWKAIQDDYEQGLSLRILADKYGVGRSTIHEHSISGQWTRTEPGQEGGQRTPPKFSDQPPQSVIATLANTMVEQLGEIAKTPIPLDLREHKLFADALGQYGKILLADVGNSKDPLQGSSEGQGVLVPHDLLPFILPDELSNIESYIVNAEQRKAQAESDRDLLERKRG